MNAPDPLIVMDPGTKEYARDLPTKVHVPAAAAAVAAVSYVEEEVSGTVTPFVLLSDIDAFAVIGPVRLPGVEAFVTKLKSVPEIEMLFPLVMAVP